MYKTSGETKQTIGMPSLFRQLQTVNAQLNKNVFTSNQVIGRPNYNTEPVQKLLKCSQSFVFNLCPGYKYAKVIYKHKRQRPQEFRLEHSVDPCE